jgi:SNF2-related domain
MANWEIQIERFVNGGARRPVVVVDRYHLQRRQAAIQRVYNGGVDILLTSYHTLAGEYNAICASKELGQEMSASLALSLQKTAKRAKSVEGDMNMFDYVFHRVVLDEGKYTSAIMLCC